jgi:hypothetical protein
MPPLESDPRRAPPPSFYAQRCMSQFAARGPLTERRLLLASSAVITVVGITIALQSLAAAGVLRI